MTNTKTDTHSQDADMTGQDVDWPRILVACQVGRTAKSTVADTVLATRLGGKIFIRAAS